jgi:outer membrane receptor protein involved in Fe transport
MSRSIVVAGLGIGLAFTAGAQQMAAPGDQVVTVTAQKRAEDVKKVPLSISVVSGEALSANQITDFADLTRAVPNVSFNSQAGAGLSTIEMRGVSSQAGSATVSIYLDDVSLTTRNLYSQGTAEPRFFDIDRVEVLRGPQGTLYGASSLAGTIRFISRQPDMKHFGGTASATVSNTDHGGVNHEVQAVLNVPLSTNTLAFRIGVQEGRESGYIDQVDPATLKVSNKDINSSRWTVLKLGAKADLGGGWTLSPSLFAQKYKSNDIDAAYLNVGSYQLSNTGAPLAIFQTSKPVREPGDDSLTVPSLTVNGDLGFADLTTVLSGYKRNFNRTQDGTSVNSAYIASLIYGNATDGKDPPTVINPALAAFSNVIKALPSAVYLENKIDQTSLELRLASKNYEPGHGLPMTWVGGVFASKTRTQVFDNEPVFGINAAFTAAGRDINSTANIPDAFVGAFTGDNSYYSARHYNDSQTSVFGELTFHASPDLRAIAGLRVLSAKQHFTREGNLYFAGESPLSALIDTKATAVTPRFSLSWDANAQTSLYANIAKGFRLGGANRPVTLNQGVRDDLAGLGLSGVPAVFGSDSLWSYELGAKSRSADGKLAGNIAAFYVNWKNIQQDVVLPTSGFDFETNAGNATSIGIESDGRVRVSPDLTFTGALGLTHAVFSSDTQALGVDSNNVLNAQKGDPIQGSPKYSARLGFDYRFKPTGTLDAYFRGAGQWTGPSHGVLIRTNSDYKRPAYFSADLSLGVNAEKWELGLFVKNLLNDHKVIQQPSVQFVNEALYQRPRTIGLTISGEI